ncbi:MAG: hypothetical protein ACOYOO_00820, partial [Saprospiraceae bacterium]
TPNDYLARSAEKILFTQSLIKFRRWRHFAHETAASSQKKRGCPEASDFRAASFFLRAVFTVA